MKIVINESQFKNLLKKILKEDDSIPVYRGYTAQVNLYADRKFSDQNIQKAYDSYRTIVKNYNTMMKSHGSPYSYKFPCSINTVEGFNNCKKSVVARYNEQNNLLVKASKYLEYLKLYYPSYNLGQDEPIYEYQLMSSEAGLGVMRRAYEGCRSAGNRDCSFFMDYYRNFGKQIDTNVYVLPEDELSQLKKQWAVLSAIAKASKEKNPLKVVQTVVKAGVEGAIETAEQAIQWVKDNFDAFMEGLRDYLGGIFGGVVNTILQLTGFGAMAVSAQWAALALYDYSKQNWIKFIFSILGLITNGTLGKALYKPFQGIWKTKVASVEDGLSKIIKNPTIKKIIGKFVNAIVEGIRFVAEGLQSAGDWLIKTFNITWAKSAITWIVNKVKVILRLLTGQVDDVALQKASEKVLQKAVIDPANTYVADKANVGKEYNVTKAGAAVTQGGSVKADPGKVVGGAVKLGTN